MLIFSSALEVLAISRREFPIILRLVVACNSYHACRKSPSLNFCSLLRRGALFEIEQSLGEVVRQQFLSLLSRPDVAKLSSQKFVGKHVPQISAVCDLGVAPTSASFSF